MCTQVCVQIMIKCITVVNFFTRDAPANYKLKDEISKTPDAARVKGLVIDVVGQASQAIFGRQR